MSSFSTDELELDFVRFLPMQISTKKTVSVAWDKLFNLQSQPPCIKCYFSTVWAKKEKKNILVWSFYKLYPHAMARSQAQSMHQFFHSVICFHGIIECPTTPADLPILSLNRLSHDSQLSHDTSRSVKHTHPLLNGSFGWITEPGAF